MSRSQHLLLLLVTAACLTQCPPPALAFTVLPSNQTFYCDNLGRTTWISQPLSEFLIVTGYSDARVLPNMRCQFAIAAPPNGSMYQLVLDRNPSLPAPPARLMIRDAQDGRILASTDHPSRADRRVADERTVLVSRPGRGITVDFETGFSVPYGQEAVQLRLRRFINCPPGWTDLDGYCFSSLTDDSVKSTRQLDFATAQTACNAMRSNLLMVSFKSGGGSGSKYIGNYTLGKLFNGVLNYRHDAWVGLADSPLQWLDGSLYREGFLPDSVRCFSSLGWPNWHCHDSERCAYFRASTDPFLSSYTGPVMDKCSHSDTARRFACYMPRNGTDTFYRVPRSHIPLLYWLLPTLGACLFLCALCLALTVRRRRRRLLVLRAAGAGGPDCCRQPILAAVPPPQFGYDAYGRPVHWYGAAGSSAGAGHVQQQQQYQGYPSGYYAPQQQQQQPPCYEKK